MLLCPFYTNIFYIIYFSVYHNLCRLYCTFSLLPPSPLFCIKSNTVPIPFHKEEYSIIEFCTPQCKKAKMTKRDILTTSGHVSQKQAIEKAYAKYDKYKNRLEDNLSR